MVVKLKWCCLVAPARPCAVGARRRRCGRCCPASGHDRGERPEGPGRHDSYAVARAIRPIALNRKNAFFAGSDGGGEDWAILASLIETCKLNGIDPQAYIADILARIARGPTINRLDRLLPWNWKTGQIGEAREPQRKVKSAVAVPAR
jgi:hypothetical protein